MRDTREFLMYPLSPVHVGTGVTIAPEEYIQDGDYLIRVNLSSVLSSLSSADRTRLEEALDRGDLKAARSMIQARARDGRYHRYRIQIGGSSRNELSNLFHDPERPRTGEIHLLPRNPYNGLPYLPGSSIKGAMRTALVNHAVNHGGEERTAQIRQTVLATFDRSTQQPNAKRSGTVLEEEAFERKSSETEWDPLRALSVSDAFFEKDSTRLDRVAVRYRDGDESRARGIQMHYERLRCQADGGEPQPARIRISIDTEMIHEVTRRMKRPLWPMLSGNIDPWDYLFTACNTFYAGRFGAEWNGFPFVHSQANGGPNWGLKSWGNVVLLRVGRFSHFDSLSVDGLRRGWNAQRKTVITDLGATRTVCELADGRRWAPMGWIKLQPVEAGAPPPPSTATPKA
ncbi:MAG: type III-A CRISPR-associated RAMP protein Csm5 [Bryobacterales bacterium]|nr:type III-A CRISPR-associated RAMP protein Csm5 [Bryobacterales bacterium]